MLVPRILTLLHEKDHLAYIKNHAIEQCYSTYRVLFMKKNLIKKKPLTDCRNQLYILKTSSITSIMVDFYTEMRAKAHILNSQYLHNMMLQQRVLFFSSFSPPPRYRFLDSLDKYPIHGKTVLRAGEKYAEKNCQVRAVLLKSMISHMYRLP